MWEEDTLLKKIKLGLIPSPDLPAELTSKFIKELPDFLAATIDDTVEWEPQIVVDPLVGSAEYMNQLMEKAVELKNKNSWDYVICLTDLPHFMEEYIVVADVNRKSNVAFVSIPAFGPFPMKYRTKRTICNTLKDMHHKQGLKQKRISRQAYKKNKRKPLYSIVSRHDLSMEGEKQEQKQADERANHPQQTTDSKEKHNVQHKEGTEKEPHAENNEEENAKDEQTQEDTTEKSDIRYIINSKVIGRIRLLGGMTLANRPWRALISFKKIIMLAFGTGIYITLFPTPWDLSIIYSKPRFVLLMFIAIFSMVTWIIFAHQLWEKPTKKGDVRLRKLYNYTTITTLFIIVLINYIVLYCLFLAAIGIFVPSELFEAVTDIKEEASMKYYFQLTWLITSLGTLAGSIGTTGEDEHKIRQITYSYRQITRYYEIQDEKNDEEK